MFCPMERSYMAKTGTTSTSRCGILGDLSGSRLEGVFRWRLDGEVFASVARVLVNAAAFVVMQMRGKLITDVGCCKTSDIACLVGRFTLRRQAVHTTIWIPRDPIMVINDSSMASGSMQLTESDNSKLPYPST
jgi:hypothetical protein